MAKGRAVSGSIWIKHTTPGGNVFSTRTDDPGYGYLDQEDPSTRYPLWYIDFIFSDTDVTDTTRQTAVEQQVREMMATAAQGVICVPYGRCRIGPNVIAWQTDGGTLYMSFAVGQGPIGGNWTVRMDTPNGEMDLTLPGTVIQAGVTAYYSDQLALSALFRFALGTQSPTVDPYYELATIGRGPSSGPGVEVFPYLAAVHARFLINSSVPDAPKPLFTFDGRTLRDPRLGVDVNGIPDEPEAYSSNVALALADYYTSSRYGLAVPDDGLIWDSVAEVADYCDVLVAGEKRHTLNWAILQNSNHRANIDTIRAHGRISVIRRDGKRVFVAKKVRSRVGLVLTEDNSIVTSVTAVPPSGMPNVVRVAWINPAKNYETDYAYCPISGMPADGRPPLVLDAVLDGCNVAGEAQRQADWLYAEANNPLTVNVLVTHPRGAEFEPVDRIGLYSQNAPLGTSEADPQDLWVVRRGRRPDGTVMLACKRYDDADYPDTTATGGSKPINTSPSPTTAPTAPTAPSGAGTLTVGDGLSLVAARIAEVNWTHPGWPYPLMFRVTRQESGGNEVKIAEVVAGPVRIDVNPLATVTVRVYAVVAATLAISTALSGSVDPATIYPEPEWPSRADVQAFETTPPTLRLSFMPPQTRTAPTFAGASWTVTNAFGAVDTSLINNGSIAAVAFSAKGFSGDETVLELDQGSAAVVKEVALSASSMLIDDVHVTLEARTSDDASSWSSWSGCWSHATAYYKYLSNVTDYRFVFDSAAVGAQTSGTNLASKRYVQFRFIGLPDGTRVNVREFQVMRWSGQSIATDRVNVYDMSSGTEELLHTITVAGTGVHNQDITYRVAHEMRDPLVPMVRAAIRLRGVRPDGVVSDPFDNFDVWSGSSGTQPSSPATQMGAQRLWNKTLSGAENTFSNLAEGTLSLADITTNDVTSTKHGLAPKSPADATKFLNGAATPAYALVKDSDLSTSDVTTNNVSTSKHGFAPKLPNDATKFLDGTGAYDRPVTTDLSDFTTGADFTPSVSAQAGTWSGYNTTTARWSKTEKEITVYLTLDSGTLSAAPSWIGVTIPGGFTAAKTLYMSAQVRDGAAGFKHGSCYVVAGTTTIGFTTAPMGTGAWTTGSSSNVDVACVIRFPTTT